MYKWIIAVVLLACAPLKAQELNCTVNINYDRITDANPQIFKSLQKAVQDFMNNTRFTSRNISSTERIECSVFLNLTSYKNNGFGALLQVNSIRPVYNSSYTTQLLNINDKDISFTYNEGENLIFNPTTFDSNLVSLLSFYANVIIGVDADSFAEKGGSDYLEAARGIANVAQSSGFKGWGQQDGNNQNRYFLINDMLSTTFEPYRLAMYNYHRKGLDTMAESVVNAKVLLMEAITQLSAIHKTRPNAYITRVFFDAKSDEIAAIFSGGPSVQVAPLVETLNRISPTNAAKWLKIK
ncbi:DUF4835 family protein [Flavobacterium sp. RNTU_13]|uniref:type IX secretion system protein PorD n=1 Tax=Flavobacterium sp. RNTU_13 TaxID=3375145 RepID=UPI003985A9E7